MYLSSIFIFAHEFQLFLCVPYYNTMCPNRQLAYQCQCITSLLFSSVFTTFVLNFSIDDWVDFRFRVHTFLHPFRIDRSQTGEKNASRRNFPLTAFMGTVFSHVPKAKDDKNYRNRMKKIKHSKISTPLSLINLSYDSIHQNHFHFGFVDVALLFFIAFSFFFHRFCLSHSAFILSTHTLWVSVCALPSTDRVFKTSKQFVNRITRFCSLSRVAEGKVIYNVMLLLTHFSI